MNDLGAMLKGRKVIRVKTSTSTIDFFKHVANKDKTIIIQHLKFRLHKIYLF